MSEKQIARTAGFFYLMVVLTGMFSLAYVPSKLIVWDNAEITVQQIKNNTMLFKYGIVSSLVCYVFFLLLPLALYKLLKPVNSMAAIIMVVLAMVSVPISFLNVQHKFAVLTLLSDNGYLQAFTNEQLTAQLMFYLHQYDKGILVVQIFWGLWLFPFGWLVYKSGFFPKVLGLLLMAGCVGYLINFTGHTLISGYAASGISTYVRLPASLGEIGTCLWLLIIGVRKKKYIKKTN